MTERSTQSLRLGDCTADPDVPTGPMNDLSGTSRQPIHQPVLERWRGHKSANRWLSDPWAMIDETATRRYTVAPDIQSLFQWQ